MVYGSQIVWKVWRAYRVSLVLCYNKVQLPAVLVLRALRYDVLTLLEAGKVNLSMPDEEVFEFVRQQNDPMNGKLMRINRPG